jgi:hypothetical protein
VRIVDRVVEPDGELDVGRMLRELGDLVEPREAFLEVLQGVVAPMLLAVRRNQLLVERTLSLPTSGKIQLYFTL